MEDRLANEVIEELGRIRKELSNIVAAIVRLDQAIMSFKDRSPLPEKSSVETSPD